VGRLRVLASHSRWFWGVRLHLVCAVSGLPIAFAIATPTADERDVARDLLESGPTLLAREGQTLLADKGYTSAELKPFLNGLGVRLIHPASRNRKPRPGQRLLKPFRQIIESVNDTLKGQLDLERHGGRTPAGLATRILQRLLALTVAILHNDHTGQPHLRSLTAYDHCDPRELII
jgi:hypothetical protein